MTETNPNLLINGNFDLWQRGVSFGILYTDPGATFGSSANTKIADRWYLIDTQIRSGGSTGSVVAYRETFGSSDSIFALSDYFLTVANHISGSTIGHCYVENKQADANVIGNTTVNLSFYAKTMYSSGVTTGTTMSCYFRQVTNPGTSQLTQEVMQFQVNPYWEFQTVSFTPKFAGTGLSGDHYFSIGFKLPSRTTVSLAAVKLEFGETPTTLMSFAEEEKKRQEKYFYTTYPIGITAGTTRTDGNDVTAISFTTTPYYTFNHKFDTVQYKNPSITLYSPITGVSGDAYNKSASRDMRLTSGTRGWNSATRFSPTGAATLTTTSSKYGVEFRVSSGAVIFDDILVHIIADADITPGSTDRGLE